MSDATGANGARGAKVKTRTRERILAAALELFIERGVDGTTVTAIERAVGLAAGTGSFYRHFRSKEEVLVASVEYGIERLIDDLDVKPGTPPRVPETVDGRTLHYKGLLAQMRDFEPLQRLIIAERHRHPELERMFTEALNVDRWERGWQDNPGAVIATAALTGYHTLSLLVGGPYRNITPDEFIATLVELTLQTDTTSPLSDR